MGILSRVNYYFSLLRDDPIYLILYIIAILMSLILHECAHGYVALWCGDPTAKYYGRLTLDPRKHLDPLGTISMLILGIGYAKPVPVNPRNFKNYRRDDILVSLAGICMNLLLFLVSTTLFVILYKYTYAQTSPVIRYLQRFLMLLAQLNVSLAIFNLLPIPPLDGYHVVNDIFLRGRFQLNGQTFQIAQIVLIVLMLTGALSGFLSTVNSALFNGLLNFLIKIFW
ncbi:MAG: site-2 protease family protein [Clostridia bacterium]|nr:site-2 protease family protein [Clostridia bacterium]